MSRHTCYRIDKRVDGPLFDRTSPLTKRRVNGIILT